MEKELNTTNVLAMTEITSVDKLGAMIADSLVKEQYVVIPGFGYLEVKSLSENRRAVLYRTAGSEHPVVKDFFSHNDNVYTSALYNFISAPLRKGNTVAIEQVGSFRPIQNADGSYRLSYTLSSSLRAKLNTTGLIESPEVEALNQGKTVVNTSEIEKNQDEQNSKQELEENNKGISVVIRAEKTKEINQDRENQPNQLKKSPQKEESRVEKVLIPEKSPASPLKKNSFFNWIAVFIVLITLAFAGIFFLSAPDKEVEEENNRSLNSSLSVAEVIDLPSLSQQHYGDPIFWVYIYEANQDILHSPVNIPKETPLIIPDLVEKGINTKDSLQIRSAKIKSDIILEHRK
jgi:nucleoid DNA-binding protein